jgi:hypothetical protein
VRLELDAECPAQAVGCRIRGHHRQVVEPRTLGERAEQHGVAGSEPVELRLEDHRVGSGVEERHAERDRHRGGGQPGAGIRQHDDGGVLEQRRARLHGGACGVRLAERRQRLCRKGRHRRLQRRRIGRRASGAQDHHRQAQTRSGQARSSHDPDGNREF